MQNRNQWRAWVAAVAFFGIAGAILYSGVFKPVRVFTTGELMLDNMLPFGETLDFSKVAKRGQNQNITFPKLSPTSEVGVEMGSLFKNIPAGAALQGSTNFSR